MLREKVQALIKTLHQRPRSRLVPLPELVSLSLVFKGTSRVHVPPAGPCARARARGDRN